MFYIIIQPENNEIKNPDHHHAVATKPQLNKAQVLHSDLVRVDPDGLLQPCIKEKFKYLLRQYDNVFSPTFKGYNGAVGALEAKVNMGPVQPPQRKGRIPQYSKTQLVTLQEKFNEFEDIGVFKKLQDIGVTAEYLNPSFLIKKPNGGFRLVTAFADVGRYSKPKPSLMPDVDSTLRQIAQWKHIVISDLTKSFYQIPLQMDSMKYCGVSTPFCGARVYVRSAMGMPGSETALEELTCRVLGHLVQEGVVAKIADDLYCGGNSPEELLTNWKDAKLRQAQRQWLPCEIEALSIAASIKHFSPYIIPSLSTACVLTDSKPCVQAFEKLCRGEFSSSPRVSTYLSTASRFQVSIRHVSGLAILPSDYSSRNAPNCDNPACQICNFIHLQEECVVRHVTTADILNGTVKLPFTSRTAWLSN
ncbi:unnamed protein product [Mytilus edulis]|uniref:Reverse transcriptase domain-containing protein n=1 Tax=Mytilus edulis TaxID=6550 RepID=A0A8S3TSC3_MYTED|nr:unnamed protein product [Mytilus edulis]